MEHQLEQISRRKILKIGTCTLTGAALVPLVVAEGCNPTMWIDTVLADLPSIITVVQSILGVVAAAGANVPANVLMGVTEYGMEAGTALNLAKDLIAGYNANPNKNDALQKIDAALVDAQGKLNQILSVFHVTDATLQAAIAAGVGGAITVVLGIEALIPAPAAATTARIRLAENRGANVIKEAFNVLVAAHYPAALLQLT